ncbi:expressed unknown protein [Seminavis robusta]|uniref:Uncharacterized protein n=1 Tax=Seminavis robusta TaxID=568900 RepID=A0A9N8DNS8_9STRA|nr:expressed unknown protein [Seminavis robusta]|eukprot:Sro181_g079120.1 n/a (141) ;mRNA; r:54201-54623
MTTVGGASFSYFRAGLIVVAVLITPACLSHWFADDAGLPMFTDGKKNKDNIDAAHLHLCALLAAAELCLYALMILLSCSEAKDLVALTYLVYMVLATILQFTHPITGEAPGIFEMPIAPSLCYAGSRVWGLYDGQVHTEG